jgi:hypothetical protein
MHSSAASSPGLALNVSCPTAAFALAFPTLVTWVYFVALARQPAAAQQGAYLVGKVLQFGFPLAWLLWVGRWPAFHRPRGRDVASGLVSGAGIAAAALGLYFAVLRPLDVFAPAAGAIQAKAQGIGVGSWPAFVALGCAYSLGHSLLEEYYWRWFVFGGLLGRLSTAAAVVLSALGFTAHHVIVLAVYFGWMHWATWFFSSCIAVGGAAWALLYRSRGSLVGPWLSHLLVDAAIFIVGFDLLRGLSAATAAP